MKFKKQNLEQSAMILMFSTLIAKVIGACFKIPLASDTFLGDLGFGYFSVAHDLFMPFYVLAISGLPAAVSHITAEFVAQKRFLDVKKSFGLTRKLFVFFGVLVSLLISLIAVPIVLLTDNSGNTMYSIIAVVPSIFLMFLISVYRGYFEGFCNMYPTAISKLIEALGKLVLGLLISFVVIKLTNNPALSAAGAMCGITLGNVFAVFYLHLSYTKNGKNLISKEQLLQSTEPNTSKNTLRIVLLLAIPMALSSLASSAVSLIDVITVRFQLWGNLDGYWQICQDMYSDAIAGYNSVSMVSLAKADLPTFLYGVRSKAFTLYNLVPTLTMAFGVGALPILTECWVKGDKSGVKSNLNVIVKLVSLITLPAGIGMVAISRPIMDLLYSNTHILGGNLLAIYGVASVFAGFAIPLTSVLQSLDRQVAALVNIIVGTVLKLVLNIILMNNLKINIYAVAISTAVCYLYIVLSHIFVITKTAGCVVDIKNTFLKPLFASLVCGGAAYISCLISAEKIVTICALVVAVLVYIVVLIATKTFEKQEILTLPSGEKLYNFGKKLKIFK